MEQGGRFLGLIKFDQDLFGEAGDMEEEVRGPNGVRRWEEVEGVGVGREADESGQR